MLRKLYRIFLRYADRNLALDRAGGPLVDASGARFGRIDRIALRGNRLIVEGWSDAARVGLLLNSTRLWTVPELTRPGSDEKGFTLDIPFETGDPQVHADRGGGAVACDFTGVTPAQIRAARLRLMLPFAAAALRLSPQIWRWKRRGDLGAREVVKERLGLVPLAASAEMSGTALAPHDTHASHNALASPPRSHDRLTIVLPVHNAVDVTRDCLTRIAAHTDLDWHLIAIEDASTDDRACPLLRDWCAGQGARATLLENDTNLGFVGSVNRGLAAARERDADAPVVLLNSDALVPAGWAARLLAPLADASVASVTPMSNDAEIFTVPVICQRLDLRAGEAEALDAAAATLNPACVVDAPTGVGFCMALAPRFLAAHPQLDTFFGRGYGEETDWCQKTRAMGGRHICAPNVFVEHRGGASFGSVDKQKLLERNSSEISRRYPRYDAEVQDFIRHDPATTARLALGLTWAAGRQDGPVPIYLAHAMGGGAEKYLLDRIAGDIGAGGAAVVLRVGQGHRWRLELHSAHGITRGATDEVALIHALIAYLPARRIVYSCGVGGHDPVALPDVLLELAEGGHAIEVLFHDFFPVSPSYTLLGEGGVYRGVPRAGGALADDPAHRHARPGRADVGLDGWQAAWGRLMAAADTCVVFSENSRDLVTQAYPQAASRLVVKPHGTPRRVPKITPPAPDGPPVIGVLGSIGYQKGAAVLQRLSRDLARSGAARLVVIGHLDPAWRLAPGAQVHGSYELRDLSGLVARYGISGWLIPSIWPETYSFTTHEALATGLPVAAFALGAQGDAVARAVAAGAPGGVLSLPQDGQGVNVAALLALMRRPVEAST